MGVILNGAQTLLPQQGASHAKPWSLERDNQRVNVLASALHRAIGAGWLTSAVLAAAVGHSVKVVAGNILFVGGVAYLLDTDLICNDTAVNATNTIWATIVPTRADQTGFANLDTYAPVLKSTQDGNPPTTPLPADAWVKSGVVVVNSGGTITALTTSTTTLPNRFVDMHGWMPGRPNGSELLVRWITPRPFTIPAALPLSQGLAGTAATASAVFSLQKNGVQFGTATFAASGTTPTFAAATDTSFVAGDLLSIVAPASSDR